MTITPREGVLTLSSGPLTYTVPFTDGEIELTRPAPEAPKPLAISGSVEFTFTAFAMDHAPLAEAAYRAALASPAPWTSTAPWVAPPIRVQVGRWWCIAQAEGVAVTEWNRADVTMRRLSPWRRVYGRGEARPRRATVIRRHR